MPKTRHGLEEVVGKLRQVDVTTSQGRTLAEARANWGRRSDLPPLSQRVWRAQARPGAPVRGDRVGERPVAEGGVGSHARQADPDGSPVVKAVSPSRCRDGADGAPLQEVHRSALAPCPGHPAELHLRPQSGVHLLARDQDRHGRESLLLRSVGALAEGQCRERDPTGAPLSCTRKRAIDSRRSIHKATCDRLNGTPCHCLGRRIMQPPLFDSKREQAPVLSDREPVLVVSVVSSRSQLSLVAGAGFGLWRTVPYSSHTRPKTG